MLHSIMGKTALSAVMKLDTLTICMNPAYAAVMHIRNTMLQTLPKGDGVVKSANLLH